MSKTEITKIILKIGDKEVELSMAEAFELKKILNDTFPEKEMVFIQSTPVVINPPPRPWYRPYDIWCSNTTSWNSENDQQALVLSNNKNL